MTSELTRADATTALLDGFLPLIEKTDVPGARSPARPPRAGPAVRARTGITRHLAAFLARATRDEAAPGTLAVPTAVLFNGGFFTPSLARTRVLDALESWFGRRPAVLENERPEAAVAMGAAYLRAAARQPRGREAPVHPGRERPRLLRRRCTPRPRRRRAICVMPRGTDEGTTLVLDRTFDVTTNQPIAFTLYSSTQRHDALNEIVSLTERDEFHRHAPLVTVLRYGQALATGQLAREPAHRVHGDRHAGALVRVTEQRPSVAAGVQPARGGSGSAGGQRGRARMPRTKGMQPSFPPKPSTQAVRSIDRVFKSDAIPQGTPESLTADLEAALGFGKQAWPLATLRRLADALLAVATGRTRSAAHEVRWLNLAGFCVRPGFGASADAWRISELRAVYAAGPGLPEGRPVPGRMAGVVAARRCGLHGRTSA